MFVNISHVCEMFVNISHVVEDNDYLKLNGACCNFNFDFTQFRKLKKINWNIMNDRAVSSLLKFC